MSAESLLRLADATRAAGDLNAAVGLYHRAAQAAPANIELQTRVGFALHGMGALLPAEAAFRRVLAADIDNAEALRGLGITLIARDMPHHAIEYLDRAVKVAGDPRAYSALGVAFDMVGERASAQAAYRTGLSKDPSNLTLMNNLGLSLAISGAHEEAVAVLGRAVRNPRATAQHRQNLALAYGLAGRLDKAAEIANTDLEMRQVRNNLNYYAWLRKQPNASDPSQQGGPHEMSAAETPAPTSGMSQPDGANIYAPETADVAALEAPAKSPDRAEPLPLTPVAEEPLKSPEQLAVDGDPDQIMYTGGEPRPDASLAWQDETSGAADPGADDPMGTADFAAQTGPQLGTAFLVFEDGAMTPGYEVGIGETTLSGDLGSLTPSDEPTVAMGNFEGIGQGTALDPGEPMSQSPNSGESAAETTEMSDHDPAAMIEVDPNDALTWEGQDLPPQLALAEPAPTTAGPETATEPTQQVPGPDETPAATTFTPLDGDAETALAVEKRPKPASDAAEAPDRTLAQPGAGAGPVQTAETGVSETEMALAARDQWDTVRNDPETSDSVGGDVIRSPPRLVDKTWHDENPAQGPPVAAAAGIGLSATIEPAKGPVAVLGSLSAEENGPLVRYLVLALLGLVAALGLVWARKRGRPREVAPDD